MGAHFPGPEKPQWEPTGTPAPRSSTGETGPTGLTTALILKHTLIYGPATMLPGIYPKELKTGAENLHTAA